MVNQKNKQTFSPGRRGFVAYSTKCDVHSNLADADIFPPRVGEVSNLADAACQSNSKIYHK